MVFNLYDIYLLIGEMFDIILVYFVYLYCMLFLFYMYVYVRPRVKQSVIEEWLSV